MLDLGIENKTSSVAVALRTILTYYMNLPRPFLTFATSRIAGFVTIPFLLFLL